MNGGAEIGTEKCEKRREEREQSSWRRLAGDVKGLADCANGRIALASLGSEVTEKVSQHSASRMNSTSYANENLDTFKLQNAHTGSCKQAHKDSLLKLSSTKTHSVFWNFRVIFTY